MMCDVPYTYMHVLHCTTMCMYTYEYIHVHVHVCVYVQVFLAALASIEKPCEGHGTQDKGRHGQSH